MGSHDATLLPVSLDPDPTIEAYKKDVGGGTYEALLAHSETRELFQLECRFVDLPTLIHLKRAAGRPKDLERIAELEALWYERREAGGE